jgi:hypothetical protein
MALAQNSQPERKAQAAPPHRKPAHQKNTRRLPRGRVRRVPPGSLQVRLTAGHR